MEVPPFLYDYPRTLSLGGEIGRRKGLERVEHPARKRPV
jgi:hypothetical protein